VAQIVAVARTRGIDQATLARRAGISPESLSRLKRSGGCRLATALELARAAGLERLVLAEPASGTAASVAARELSAGRRRAINAAELVRALAADKPGKRHRAHLLGFFEELPLESVHDVALDEGLDYHRLLALARALGAEGETVDWLEEMAGNGLA